MADDPNTSVDDPSQATVINPPPDYIREKTMTGTIKWTFPPTKKVLDNIEIFDFSFLGQKFGPVPPAPPGVNAELTSTTRLQDAQRKLYDKALLEKQKSKPDATQLKETEFKDWCWAGQLPPQSPIGAKDIGNSRSRHSSGSAIDIDAFNNPWAPVRTNGVFGGENDFPKGDFKGSLEDLLTERVWKPAVDIYDRALSLWFPPSQDPSGKRIDAQVHAELNGANAASMFERFRRTSYAVDRYFSFAFNRGDFLALPQEDFESRFQLAIDFFKVQPTALHANRSDLVGALNSPRRKQVLTEYYRKIISDFAVMRLAIVSGKLLISADGTVSLPSSPPQRRHPRNGIFNMRPEVFVELVLPPDPNETEKGGVGLRWGGAMFDRFSGDTMHFDTDRHLIKGRVFKDTIAGLVEVNST